MIRKYPIELLDSIMFLLFIGLWIWIIVEGETFLAGIIGINIGLMAVRATRSLYTIIRVIWHKQR